MTSASSPSGPSPDDQRSATPVIEQILQQALQAFACDAASLLGYDEDGRVELLVSTDRSARRADQLQLGLDEGVAVSARQQDDVALSGNTDGDRRWPRWGSAAAGLGWQSVLSAPLTGAAGELGVLTLYAHRSAAFDATHAYAARLFADHAATALSQVDETEHLREALAARRALGLAQGIVMEQHGLGPDTALELLQRESQDRGTDVRTLAERVVAAGRLDSEPPGLEDRHPRG